jgi:hypothetical protein
MLLVAAARYSAAPSDHSASYLANNNKNRITVWNSNASRD